MPDLVSVACKLPQGLNIGGAVLLGTRADQGAGFAQPQLFGGYRITDNVPREVWERWRRANEDAPVCRNGIVFADADRKALVDRARGSKGTPSGMEPMGGGQKRTK